VRGHAGEPSHVLVIATLGAERRNLDAAAGCADARAPPRLSPAQQRSPSAAQR
jgi:hypothetical protein